MNELENDLTTVETSAESKPKLAFIDDEQRILRSMKLLFRKTHDVLSPPTQLSILTISRTTMYTWRSVTSGCLSESVWISYAK